MWGRRFSFRLLQGALVALFLLVLIGPCFSSASTGWDFKDPKEAAKWTGTAAFYSNGALVVHESDPVVTSPVVQIPASNTVVTLLITSSLGGEATIGVAFPGSQYFTSKDFTIIPSEEPREYSVSFKDAIPKGAEHISRVGLVFRVRDTIAVHSVELKSPSAFDPLRLLWAWFWEPDFVKGSTIGFVTTPRVGSVNFMYALYCLILLVFIVACVYMAILRRYAFKDAATKALFLGLALSGLLLGARMDYNWLVMWKGDIKDLSGKDEAERIVTTFRLYDSDFSQFYAHMDSIKKAMPEGAYARSTRPDDNELSLLGKYFLLPIRTKKGAEYVWTYKDSSIYDPVSFELTKGGKVIAVGARPVFGDGFAALYKAEAGR